MWYSTWPPGRRSYASTVAGAVVVLILCVVAMAAIGGITLQRQDVK
jgi:hypothetical protein